MLGRTSTVSLHPDFPIVTGNYQLTDQWWLDLPDRFNRRIEDGSLVLWRPELTFWAIAWGNDLGASQEERLASILESADPGRKDVQVERTPSLTRLTYELYEEDSSRSPSSYTSISGYVLSNDGELQISAYCDTPAARSLAYRVLHSAAVRPNT
jgi:hypothetical protein